MKSPSHWARSSKAFPSTRGEEARMLGIAELGATDPALGDGPTVSIDMEYLGTLEVQLDPPQMVGQRMIFNTTGGTIKGPKIRGTIVDPSGDWLMPMPDGSLRLDVRATIKTAEGEFILVEYNGVIVVSKEVTERLSKDEKITYRDAYFLRAPRFTTASKTYDWLNKTQAIGKMVSMGAKDLKYDIFAVR
jgi:hypothetical protein